jgi:chlorobactene lauroyltransferase
MLKVRRSRVYTRWFGWYSRRQFRRHFYSVRVLMPPELQQMDLRTPVIFYCNHAFWWDGFWSQLCTELYFRQNLHIVIDYSQLSIHRFFTRVGAFSVDRSKPKGILQTIDYAAECLLSASHRQNALWIFPQGRIEHVDRRPVRFSRGTALIAERVLKNYPRLYLVSVVSRIEYLEEQKPELFLSFGLPVILEGEVSAGIEGLTRQMEETTERHLDQIKQCLVERELQEFRVVLTGSESVNRRAEKIGRLMRFRLP